MRDGGVVRALVALVVGGLLVVGGCADSGSASPHAATATPASLSTATPPPLRVNLAAVAARDRDHIVTVGGTDGQMGKLVVARSDDGGATWTVTSVPVPALSSVAWAGQRLVGATRCVPSYTQLDGGAIETLEPIPTVCLYESTDGGETWQTLAPGRLVDPSFSDALHGWAHSPTELAEPALYSTADGGRTWRAMSSPCPSGAPLIASAITTGPGTGYVLCSTAGSDSSDDGAWSLMEVAADGTARLRSSGHHSELRSEPWVFGVTMRPDHSGFLSTSTGLLATDDHGVSWRDVPPSGLPDGVFGARGSLPADGSVVFVRANSGDYSGIVESLDGKTWRVLAYWPYF